MHVNISGNRPRPLTSCLWDPRHSSVYPRVIPVRTFRFGYLGSSNSASTGFSGYQDEAPPLTPGTVFELSPTTEQAAGDGPTGTEASTQEGAESSDPCLETEPKGTADATQDPVSTLDSTLDLLLSKANIDLDDNERRQARDLLQQVETVFHRPGRTLRATSLVEHQIDLLPDSKPVFIRQYKSSFAEEDEMRKVAKAMLEDGVIQPSRSPFNAPMILVKKANGETRPVIDFRGLNKVTVPDRYPMLRTDVALNSLTGMTVFSSLDLKQGFWQIPIRQEDQPKTAFTIPGMGHFEWTRLPFGLINSPATFCRLVNTVLGARASISRDGRVVSLAQAYVDDIIIASTNVSDHLDHLHQVLTLLDEARLTVNPTKCTLFQHQLKFLGHVIGRDGISTDPEKTAKIAGWPRPRNMTEMQQFLGFANYYRKFIKGFSVLTKPLRDLTVHQSSYTWTPEVEDSFMKLKALFLETPILAYPQMDKPFIIYTDASYQGLGYSLHQLQPDGTERPIAFGGRALALSEKKYEVTELECLGLVEAVRYFHEYVCGAPITVYTDHVALVSLLKKKETRNRKLRTGMLALQTYDIEICYNSGKHMAHVDALSRHPTYGEPETGLADMVFSMDLARAPEWTAAQAADPWCRDIRQALSAPTEAANATQDEFKRIYRLVDGLLCLAKADGSHRVLVPASMRHSVLVENHDHALAGHYGQRKTFDRLARIFYWPTMYADTVKHVRSCQACQKYKSPAPLLSRPADSSITQGVTQALQCVNMDIKGPLNPKTANGNLYILIFTDVATRWVEAFPMPDQQAETVAKYFVEGFICRHGCPRELTSDRGSNFMSSLLRQVNALLQVKHRLSSPYSPWVNGCVERVNGTIMQILSHYTEEHPEDWDNLLPFALYAYRTARHDTCKASPFFLMFGRHPVGPTEASLGAWKPTATQTSDAGVQLQTLLHNALQTAAQARSSPNNSILQQPPAPATSPMEGDQVWVKEHKAHGNTNKALQPHWKGPFNVVSASQHTIHLQDPLNHNHPTTAHVRNTKAYTPPLQGTGPATTDTIPTPITNPRNPRNKPVLSSPWDPVVPAYDPDHPNVPCGFQPLQPNEFLVEKILEERKHNGEPQYLVKWLGYPDSDNTWEPRSNLLGNSGRPNLELQRWEQRHQ